MRIQSDLAKIRATQGVSAASLASQVGVKRQTIYAIEAGRYIPNTRVAVSLAQALGVSVEELFRIEKELKIPEKAMQTVLLATPATSWPCSEAIQLCKVGNHWVGVPSSPIRAEVPEADAMVVKSGPVGKAAVQPFRLEREFKDRLIIAGCDPAMAVLTRYLARHGGVVAIVASCSSLQALNWLKERKIHIAGTHLRKEMTQESTLTVVRDFFPKGRYRAVNFSVWEEGLVVARGNPKGIRTVADLARRDLIIVNREVGSGSRFLLDSLLKKEGITSQTVSGYEHVTSGHMLAAWHVQSQQADCCVATRAAARAFALGFIPLATERYDLIIPDRFWGLPAVGAVLDAINHSALRRELEALGGYDTSQTGRILN